MSSETPRPNFFIAGSPKCGTSSMHDYLGQHPEVYMSEEMKEPGYFNPDLRINLVRRMLGRPYGIEGIVAHGACASRRYRCWRVVT